MKRALCFVAVLGFVASASAGIDMFITKAADADVLGGDIFNATETNLYPSFTAPDFATLDKGPHDQLCGTTESYYVWVDMAGYFDAYCQVYAIDNRGSVISGNASIGQSVYYRQAGGTHVRWDGAGPLDFPDSSVIAITASGLVNDTALLEGKNPAEIVVFEDPDGDSYLEHAYFLVGAFEFTCGDNPCDGGLSLDVGTLGWGVRLSDEATHGNWDVVNYDWTPGNKFPFTYMGTPWDQGPVTAITCVPEPASMLLLGLASFFIRRR